VNSLLQTVVLEEILVRIVLYNWTFDRFHMKTHKKSLPLSFSYTAVSSATKFSKFIVYEILFE